MSSFRKVCLVPNFLVSQDVLTRVLVRIHVISSLALESTSVNGFKLTLCGIHNLSNLSAERLARLCC